MIDTAATTFEAHTTFDFYKHLTIDDAMLGHAFERLCRLASRILKTPISMVSVIQGEYQRTRMMDASGRWLDEALQTPVAHSFCKHVIASGTPLIVDDALLHPLVRDNPAIHEHDVKAYLGMPLVLDNGQVLGSFCVVDSEPHPWSQADIDVLRDLAASVMSEIELRYSMLQQERTANELRGREQLLQKLLATFPAGIISVLDADMRWTYAAGAGLAPNGLRADDLIGKHLDDVFSAHVVEAIGQRHREVLGGATVEFEFEDGDAWFSVNATPMLDEHGQIDAVLSVAQDITDRKLIDVALRESEARFYNAFALSHAGMALVDLQGYYLYANPALCEMLGYSEDELRNLRHSDIAHPDDADVTSTKARLIREGVLPSFQMEKRYIHKSGETIWALVSISLQRDDNGAPQCYISQHHNISKRKQAEQAVLESEARFRVLFESSPDGIILYDRRPISGTMCVVDANPAACKMHGYTRDELIGMPLMTLNEDDGDPSKLDNFIELIRTAGMVQAEDWHRRKDGSRFQVEYSTSLVHVGDVELVLGIDRDITERKRMEASLRESEERFRSIFEHAPIGVFMAKADSKIAAVNQRFLDILGYDVGVVVDLDLLTRMIYPDDLPDVQRMFADLRRRTYAIARMEHRCMHSDGHVVWVQTTASPILDSNGAAASTIVMVEDITEHRRIEEALRQSEELFRSVNQHALIGVCAVSMDGRFVQVNPALVAFLGYAEAELKTMVYTDVTHPDDIDIGREQLRLLSAREIDFYQLEKRYVHRDGTTRWGFLNASLVTAANGDPLYYIGQIQDITEQKRVEEDLEMSRRRLVEIREAERLHLARELHDGAVQQLIGISYQMVERPQRATDSSDEAAAAARQRAHDTSLLRRQILDVVSQLRSVMRELRPPGLEELGLPAAIEGYVAQLRAEYDGELPDVVLQLDPNDGRLTVPVGVCLFRVMQEAMRNAIHHADADRITVALSFYSDVVELTVHDDGRGFVMPPHVSQLVHEHHYGFAGMSERVAAVGGHLSVDTQLGEGTTVCVRVGLEATSET